MSLDDHIQSEHNGDRTAFARNLTKELKIDGILEGAKHFTLVDVDRWIKKGALWIKGQVKFGEKK